MPIAFGPLSTYIVPETLVQEPTGISWASLPYLNASDAEQYQAQVLLCNQATSMVDSRCNQVLRATIQTETLYGPDFRVNQMPNGTTRLLLSQWPVLSVQQIRVANASVLPYQWTTVPVGAYAPELPPLLVGSSSVASDAGTGGQAVILGPGYVNWWNGRMGWVIEVTYTAGYPHCGIAANASKGDETLQVDDCTGWAPGGPGMPGAGGVIQDTAGNQEAISCLASSVTSGPGELTLSSPLSSAHDAGILLTALPGQIQWAAVLFASSMALMRGATATTIQSQSGRGQASASGHKALKDHACELLGPYRRII